MFYKTERSQIVWLPLIACLITVLALLITCGDVAGEGAYATFLSARRLVNGQAITPFAGHPLFVVLLAAISHLGLSIPQAGTALSVLGWLLAIAAVYCISLRFDRPAMAIFAAAALSIEPVLFQMLGRDTLFVMGWLWGALAFLSSPVSWALLIALAGSVLYHAVFSSSTYSVMWETYALACLPALTLLLGWVVDWIIGRIDRVPGASGERSERRVWAIGVLLVALLGWGYVRNSFSLFDRVPHTAERVALWAQAGLWLHQNTPSDASVWSDDNSALAYFSERAIIPKFEISNLPVLAERPGKFQIYCVSLNSLAWAEQVNQPWFQEHYRRVHTIANPYDTLAPLVIWRYRHSPFDIGEERTVGASFGPSLELSSYRLDAAQLIPGEPLHLTLTWRATEPITQSLSVRVSLYDPNTRLVLAQVDQPAPSGIATTLWPFDRALVDRYTLPVPDSISPGTYSLDVRVYEDMLEHVAPVSGGEQLTLAQLEAQPSISQEPLRPTYPLTATFGDTIELTGYDARPFVERGQALRVRLYWHALDAPGAYYQVFVHILADDGQLVAQHDGVPVQGAHPTNEWQAGQYVLDEHLVPIDASISPGRYWLKVGMYMPDSGERLVVCDQAGLDVPDQSLPLMLVDVE